MSGKPLREFAAHLGLQASITGKNPAERDEKLRRRILARVDAEKLARELAEAGPMPPADARAPSPPAVRDAAPPTPNTVPEKAQKPSRNVFGNWTRGGSLGEGGQAHTFLATRRDPPDDHQYVIKLLKNKKRIDRFKVEVKILKQVEHPNVLRVIDADLDGDKAWYVAPFCSGGSLEQVNLSELTILERLIMFRQICLGVQAAHEAGAMHRDIKPANVFLLEDRCTPIVGDFGLCFLRDEPRATETGEGVGPRHYMAPELEDGRLEDVEKSVDVYSLGKLLYWMLTGRIFSREKHRVGAFDLTKDGRAEYLFIYEILDRTIAFDPKERFATVTKLMGCLDTVITRVQADALPTDLTARLPCRWCFLGEYRPVVTYDPKNPERNSNLLHSFARWTLPNGHARILILVCSHCGHTQMFRPDHAQDANIWRLPERQ